MTEPCRTPGLNKNIVLGGDIQIYSYFWLRKGVNLYEQEMVTYY